MPVSQLVSGYNSDGLSSVITDSVDFSEDGHIPNIVMGDISSALAKYDPESLASSITRRSAA